MLGDRSMVFSPGDEVEAIWEDGHYYKAVVIEFNSKSQLYKIKYPEYNQLADVPEFSLRKKHSTHSPPLAAQPHPPPRATSPKPPVSPRGSGIVTSSISPNAKVNWPSLSPSNPALPRGSHNVPSSPLSPPTAPPRSTTSPGHGGTQGSQIGTGSAGGSPLPHSPSAPPPVSPRTYNPMPTLNLGGHTIDSGVVSSSAVVTAQNASANNNNNNNSSNNTDTQSGNNKPKSDFLASMNKVVAGMKDKLKYGVAQEDLATLTNAQLLSRSQYDGLSQEKREKMATTRSKVIGEILDTEKSYVMSLLAIQHLYMGPMAQEALLQKNNLRVLFGNIEEIAQLHMKFQQELQAVLTPSSSSSSFSVKKQPPQQQHGATAECIGSVFTQYAPSLKIYTEYVINHPKAMKYLEKLCSANDKVRVFLEKQRNQAVTKGQSLESFLIMPIQRIPRYVLLLAEVIKNTPPNHPDSQAIQTASKEIAKTATEVNEGVRQREEQEVLVELQKSVEGFKVTVAGRRLIKEGVLNKVKRGGEPGSATEKDKAPDRENSTKERKGSLKWDPALGSGGGGGGGGGGGIGPGPGPGPGPGGNVVKDKDKSYTFFLFNDVLLYGDKNLLQKYQIKGKLDVDEGFAVEPIQLPSDPSEAGQAKWRLGFTVRSSRAEYWLYAKDTVDRSSWMEAMTKLAQGPKVKLAGSVDEIDRTRVFDATFAKAKSLFTQTRRRPSKDDPPSPTTNNSTSNFTSTSSSQPVSPSTQPQHPAGRELSVLERDLLARKEKERGGGGGGGLSGKRPSHLAISDRFASGSKSVPVSPVNRSSESYPVASSSFSPSVSASFSPPSTPGTGQVFGFGTGSGVTSPKPRPLPPNPNPNSNSNNNNNNHSFSNTTSPMHQPQIAVDVWGSPRASPGLGPPKPPPRSAFGMQKPVVITPEASSSSSPTQARRTLIRAPSTPLFHQPALSDDMWYYGLQGNSCGPVSSENIKELVGKGVLDSESYVWRGEGEWQQLKTVAALRKQSALDHDDDDVDVAVDPMGVHSNVQHGGPDSFHQQQQLSTSSSNSSSSSSSSSSNKGNPPALPLSRPPPMTPKPSPPAIPPQPQRGSSYLNNNNQTTSATLPTTTKEMEAKQRSTSPPRGGGGGAKGHDIPTCCLDEVNAAVVHCYDCDSNYCADCDDFFHTSYDTLSHNRVADPRRNPVVKIGGPVAFEVGQPVTVVWHDGITYLGEVSGGGTNGTYPVKFIANNDVHMVEGTKIHALHSNKPQQQQLPPSDNGEPPRPIRRQLSKSAGLLFSSVDAPPGKSKSKKPPPKSSATRLVGGIIRRLSEGFS